MKETFSARVILLKRGKWERSIAREHWEGGGDKIGSYFDDVYQHTAH